MQYLGDFLSGKTVDIFFTTSAAAGGAVAPSSAFEIADVMVYKNNSATQRSSAAGMTMTSPFDSITGLHQVHIDLSDNTDAGFWAPGNDYTVVLSPDTETVDAQAVVAVLARFSLENRPKPGVYSGTVTGASSPTTIVDSGLTEAATDFWRGRIVIFTSGALKGQATDITAFTPGTDTLTVSTLTGTPTSGDKYCIY